MVRIHKYNDVLGANTNPYIFKNFNFINNAKKDEVGLQNDVNKFDNTLKNASAEANKIVDDAHKQADKIINKANEEADMMMSRAVLDGYQKGLSLVNNKVEKLIEEANLKTDNLIEETKLKTGAVFNELEQNSIDICLNIAKKILDVELNRNDTAMIPVIKQAINKIKKQTEVKVTLQEQDLRNLENTEAFQMLKEQCGNKFQFVSDSNMKKGDALIQTDSEIIDAGITTQFLNIKNALSQNI